MKLVFQKLRENKIFVKRSKCALARTEIEQLGHIISSKGVAADQIKIEAMINWQVS